MVGEQEQEEIRVDPGATLAGPVLDIKNVAEIRQTNDTSTNVENTSKQKRDLRPKVNPLDPKTDSPRQTAPETIDTEGSVARTPPPPSGSRVNIGDKVVPVSVEPAPVIEESGPWFPVLTALFLSAVLSFVAVRR